jgi:sarcosine/dimethylglycine N-methyltransferase
MKQQFAAVRDHYQAAIVDAQAVLGQVAQQLEAIEGPLSAERTGNFDQFHVGGLAATAELARRVGVTAGMRVLDAGSGLGGPSRYLARTFGAEVVGVDLAPTYVAVAELLARRTGLHDRVSYRAGSITDLPLDDDRFDLVWTQHVVMNIVDRHGLYRELRRVLKRGGRLAFYDPYLPDEGEPPIYPTPWAATAAASTLLTKGETVAALEQVGLSVTTWEDVTALGRQWIAAQQEQLQHAAQATPGARPPLSLGLFLGAQVAQMVANFGRNIAEGRVRLVMGICEAV